MIAIRESLPAPSSPFARARLAWPLPHPSEPLLDRLWTRYVHDVPYARAFVDACGGVFENDHVAFRSLARDGDGIALFAPIFERRGWRRAGHYTFPDLHLRAIHLSRPGFPRVFLSELDATKLPAAARDALMRMPMPDAPPRHVDELAAWFREPPPPSARDLELVGKVSQYGAWLLAFGRRVNHFTARVDDVQAWQDRLTRAGVPMKGEIEGAAGSGLRQTATAAAKLDVLVREGGTKSAPYAYFEIAERQVGFDGFLGPQARQLFDMTRPGAPPRAPPYGPELRKHERRAVLLHVELGYGSTVVPVTTENISLGGVFLQLPPDAMPKRHAAIEMAIALPDGTRLEAAGTVVYVVEGRGVGVQFSWWDEVEHPERRRLARLLYAE